VSIRVIMLAGAAAAALLAAAIGFIFQDNIAKYLLNPRTPFQLSEQPPPPAYGARGAWAIWPDDPAAGEADIFYIHSTTYASRAQWNAPLTDKGADQTLRRVAAPNEAGPFFTAGAIYGPRYRQATLFSRFTHKFDGLAARRLAYEDVTHAFERFLSERRQERPIIIAGYEQGGLYALGLLQHYFARDEKLRRQLAAAYIIQTGFPLSLFDDQLRGIPPCQRPNQTRCVISYIAIEPGFDDEKRRLGRRALAWSNDRDLLSLSQEPILCTNPLGWTTAPARAKPDLHLGAASATGLHLGETPPPIPHALGAQCIDGVLAVDRPRQQFLRRHRWFGRKWRTPDFNLFYHDLAADAVRRTALLKETLDEEARLPGPHEDAVDPEPAPVNKVPD